MTGLPVAVAELVGVDYLNEVARGHWRKTTAKAVTNTTAETDLLNGEISIGAGAMSTNRVVRLTAWGDWIQNSGGATGVAQEFKLKLGATVLLDTAAMGIAGAEFVSNANRMPWRITAEIMNLGATNSQWATLLAEIGIVETSSGVVTRMGAFTTGEGGWSYPGSTGVNRFILRALGANTGAVDTTVAQTLALTVINPTLTATCETKLLGALVEII